MKVYITTYCLTKGIIEADMEQEGASWWGMLPGMTAGSYWNKNEAFADLEDAKNNCRERVTKNIKSLEKQIELLKSMRF